MKVGETREESQLRQSKGQWKTVNQELVIHSMCTKKFTSCEDMKNAIRQHAVETRRELDFIKNEKNRVKAICKGTIPDLGQLDPCGPSQSNKESEENNCPWIESNPTVPTRALQEQLQREYQVDILKMKVFRAKTEALNQVRGDYAGQYTTLRDYVQELHTRNPGTTVKIEGLLQAIGTLYPCAEYKFCLRHIHENMKKMWRGKVFQDMLWNCASTTTIQEFNHAMEELRKLNNDCYEWVKAIPPQHWSRAHFTGRAHCDGLLNNLCETINNQIKKARDQPIITCLEYIREYLMLRIVSIQKVSGPWMDQCVVDMAQHTCSCRKWELIGITCKHVLVAIWDMRKNKHNVGVLEEWVHATYWLKTWKEMYSFKIEPINGRRMWEKFPCPTTLLPPNHHVPIGRPWKKRRKSAVELEDMVKGGRASRKDKSVTCLKCKKLGHNKRSCKGQSACDTSSSKKGKAGNKAKSVGDGSSIKKGKDGKKGQSAGDGSSSKKGNVGKKAQSVGGGRQSGTHSACDGISSRTKEGWEEREEYFLGYDCVFICCLCVMNQLWCYDRLCLLYLSLCFVSVL
ncbi:unnamed protein product [Lactuca saligna]|uniref:SWIM-type domain-containing protein n=1 Tax=Lactuca saligna TaxID=75948 RepID=A0AA35ZKE3_LACSI|nr:unnamed protein product [Lactuca saligna]